jgi:hypothetical protein
MKSILKWLLNEVLMPILVEVLTSVLKQILSQIKIVFIKFFESRKENDMKAAKSPAEEEEIAKRYEDIKSDFESSFSDVYEKVEDIVKTAVTKSEDEAKLKIESPKSKKLLDHQAQQTLQS